MSGKKRLKMPLPNPRASVPLREGFPLRGTHYDGKAVKDGYGVTPVESG